MAVGEYCIQNNKLYRCNTTIQASETWTAAHWTEAQVGDEVASLKSAIDLTNTDVSNIREAFVKSTNLFNADDPDVLPGEYITDTGATGTSGTGTLSESGWIAVEPSTAYTIGADGSDHPRYVTEYDSEKNVISGSGANDTNIVATTATTAYIRFAYRNQYPNWRMNKGNTLLAYEPYYVNEILTDTTLTDETLPANAAAVGQKIGEVEGEISALESDFDGKIAEIASEYTESETEETYYTTPWTNGGGINKSGSFVEVASWGYTNKIPVAKDDIITCDRLNGSLVRVSAPIRYLCAYSGDTPVQDSGSNDEIQSYTVPVGITHIIVTQASMTSYTGQRVVIKKATTHTEYYLIQDKIGGFRQSGSLSDGEQFSFPVTNVKQYKEFSFSATVASFSSLVIGRYVDNAVKESVTIGTTKITVNNTYGTGTDFDYPTEQLQPTDPPVFTVGQNIQVLIVTGKRNRLTLIRIISNGVVFEVKENQLQNITWNADKGYPFVKSVGSTLTDCFASWTTRKINAPIWIFGDSYLSYDMARWTYYLIEDGYDVDCMLNAYAGENSSNAVIAFDNLIKSARPKMIVWALGMNDPDSVSDDAPNGNWANAITHIKSICDQKNIELVLCTIPTTERMNNNYKNEWIKEDSHMRYIDFAAGVGAGTDGQWFTGLLDTDEVHPTVEGAKTLYYTFLSQFPEILINN